MNASLFPDMAPPDPSSGLYTAHCDGGARGNPGPAGYGAVVEDPHGRIVARLSDYLGKQTNNFAEYSGLLAVLRWAIENHVQQLKVVSDSELMVKQMKGVYKVASPSLKPLWDEAKRLAGRLERFQMAHTLRGGNKEADKLANDAMDRGMGKNRDQMSTSGQGTAIREQGTRGPAQQFGSASALRPGTESRPPRQVFEGLVKNGVVHLIEGELPDGILVKVIRE
ncbi:MAG TPA: ribonuclease HI family protein [Terracidiphilus sp.]|jgi:probable phosphoglycerate mutase|nr:ribonuclease HI family protein [Terracidiphilus sp.]